jgi:hypothetical protein
MMTTKDVPECDRLWLNACIDEKLEDLESHAIMLGFRLAVSSGSLEEYSEHQDKGVEGRIDWEFEGAPSGTTYLYGINCRPIDYLPA